MGKTAYTLLIGIMAFAMSVATGQALAQTLVTATSLRMVPSKAPLSATAHDAMVHIPEGAYPIGASAEQQSSASPAHNVGIPAFVIDRTEVTNAQYAEFLNALGLTVRADAAAGEVRRHHLSGGSAADLLEGDEGSGAYPLIALDDDQARIEIRSGRFSAATGYADHPVAETTWRGARDYCLWRGARLPSEAEWEAAARGREGRLYPWGDAPPSRDRAYAGYRSGQTAPVGSRPAGATSEGLQDMAGSLAEWTSSLLRAYPYDATDGREDQTASGARVTRGGDYVYDTEPQKLTSIYRDGFSRAPERGHRHIGFRCAGESNR